MGGLGSMSVSGLLSDLGWAVLTGGPGLRSHCHIYSPSSIAGLERGSFSEEIRGVRVAVQTPHTPTARGHSG